MTEQQPILLSLTPEMPDTPVAPQPESSIQAQPAAEPAAQAAPRLSDAMLTDQERAAIEEAAREIPIFFSYNMSLGIALLARLAKETAKWFPDADIEIVEAHHNRKLDVPSGTALLLADAIREVRPEAEYVIGRHENGRRKPQDIGIHSLRLGNEVGTHEILVTTGTQTITLKHEAKDRSLFAEGALAAAEFLAGKPAGLYTMQDMMKG